MSSSFIIQLLIAQNNVRRDKYTNDNIFLIFNAKRFHCSRSADFQKVFTIEISQKKFFDNNYLIPLDSFYRGMPAIYLVHFDGGF